MNARERLDAIAADHADDHPYCADCPLMRSVVALRAVLDLCEHNSTVAGHPEWVVTSVPTAELHRAITTALDGAS